jgi:hypothetical protein
MCNNAKAENRETRFSGLGVVFSFAESHHVFIFVVLFIRECSTWGRSLFCYPFLASLRPIHGMFGMMQVKRPILDEGFVKRDLCLL